MSCGHHEWLLVVFLLIGCWTTANGFTTPLSQSHSNIGLIHHHHHHHHHHRLSTKYDNDSTRLYLLRKLLRRGGNDNNDDDDEEDTVTTNNDDLNLEENSTSSGSSSKTRRILPFFASKREEEEVDKQTSSNNVDDGKEKALKQAKLLKAQAERARLEAEKLDVILTLDKITKLEKELNTLSIKNNNTQRQKDLQNQIEILQKKLNGEEPTPPTTTTTPITSESDDVTDKETEKEVTAVETLEDAVVLSYNNNNEEEEDVGKKSMVELSQEEIQARVDKFNQTPDFMKKIIAQTVGRTYQSKDDFNVTSLILKLHQEEQDYLEDVKEMEQSMPKFTDEEIQERVDQLKNVPQFVKNLYGNDAKNDTAIAINMLEQDWRDAQSSSLFQNKDEKDDDKNSFDKLLKQFTAQTEDGVEAEQNRMMQGLFPDSTRKEDVDITSAQIKSVVADIAKVWQSSTQPVKVSGGYIIRGTPKPKFTDSSGDDLIDAIDSCMTRSTMKGQVSIFYIYDPTPVTEDQMNDVMDRPPVLFVTGPDVARESQFFARTAISGLALGTTWYASLYPYLMNDKILKAAEDQLALADASMPSDLSWLTDSSVPLFLAFLGIQVSHELGHRLIASMNNVQLRTIPTLVPSLVTGITNTITSLKEPPKNRQALFDFAIAGPLVGIATSLAVLYYGLLATSTMDAASYANLPALPLEFLRQSSLGGAIIESVLGAGILDVPDAAAGTAAVANLNIPLHPFAIAGYLGLLVNAISLWPVGSKYNPSYTILLLLCSIPPY